MPFRMGVGRVHMRGSIAEAEMEYHRAGGQLHDQSLPEPRLAAEQTPLVPRAMGRGMRGVGGLRTAAQDGEEVGSVKEMGLENVEGGLKGLRERLREVKMEEERRVREVIEGLVAEELAREGRSWGPS